MKPMLESGLLLVLLGLSTAAGGQPSQSADDQRRPNADFVRLDANQDGYLTRKEVTRDKTVNRNFLRFDENKDSRLTDDEFTKLRSTLAREKAVAYVDDSTITAKVKAALLNAKNIKSINISVTTTNGVVMLTGAAANSGQAKRAGAIAVRVKGVKKVDNRLTTQ